MNKLLYLCTIVAAMAAAQADAKVPIGSCFTDAHCKIGARLVQPHAFAGPTAVGANCVSFMPLRNVFISSSASCVDDEQKVKRNGCGTIDSGNIKVVCVRPG